MGHIMEQLLKVKFRIKNRYDIGDYRIGIELSILVSLAMSSFFLAASFVFADKFVTDPSCAVAWASELISTIKISPRNAVEQERIDFPFSMQSAMRFERQYYP